MSAASRPAKITPPQVGDAVDRERLFALLDSPACRRTVWIAAPAGAGKTVLATSYLASRGMAHLWLQVDANDSNPAELLKYLAMLEPSGTAADLTQWGPEFEGDTPTFAKRFFRALYAHLPKPSALVLDNCHEPDGSSPFNAIIAEALSELPQGIRLMMLSRAEPPAELMRARANRELGLVGWEALRCTDDEAAVMTAALRGLDRETVKRIVAMADGWLAGVVLLAERQRLSPADPLDSTAPLAADDLWRYFAQEVLDRAPTHIREFLVHVSFLPWMTGKLACALTGHDGAEEILARLYHGGLFTYRFETGTTTYRLHNLFLAIHARRALVGAALRVGMGHLSSRGESRRTGRRSASRLPPSPSRQRPLWFLNTLRSRSVARSPSPSPRHAPGLN